MAKLVMLRHDGAPTAERRMGSAGLTERSSRCAGIASSCATKRHVDARRRRGRDPFCDRHRRTDGDVGAAAVLRGGDLAAAARNLPRARARIRQHARHGGPGAQPPRRRSRGRPRGRGEVLPIPRRSSGGLHTVDKSQGARGRRAGGGGGDAPPATLAPGLEMESLRTQLALGDRGPGVSLGHRAPRRLGRLVRERARAGTGTPRGARRGDAPLVRASSSCSSRPFHTARRAPAGGATGAPRKQLGESGRARDREGRSCGRPDLYYARAAADEAKALVSSTVAFTARSPRCFRDLIGASRKFAIAFLDWCDRTGSRLRVGDVRKLRRVARSPTAQGSRVSLDSPRAPG